MERRKFISASVWSALGATLLPGSLLSQSSSLEKISTISLLKKLGFHKYTYFLIEEGLLLNSDKFLEHWKISGYMPLGKGVFWLADNNYAVLPVKQSNPQLDQTILCTLHFVRKSNTWAYCGSLNHYQIAAINQAFEDLHSNGNSLSHYRQLLLPNLSQAGKSKMTHTFCTQLGLFSINTKITEENTFI